jgi:CHAT domain-containing protein
VVPAKSQLEHEERKGLTLRTGAAIAVCLLLGLTQSPARGRHSSVANRIAVALLPAKSELLAATPKAREISLPARHWYALDLSAGDYVRVTVDHQGIDVGVSLYSPDGIALVEVRYRQGSQVVLSTIAHDSGQHLLEIRSLEATTTSGRYIVALKELRHATAHDVETAKAASAFVQAEALAADWQSQSSTAVLQSYRAALEHWTEAADLSGQALAVRKVGETYLAIGQTDSALPQFLESLRLSQLAENAEAECAARSALGRLYLTLGNMNAAAEHGGRALQLSQEMKYPSREAEALNLLGDIDAFRGRTRESLDLYERALSISKAGGDRRGEAQATLNLGYTHSDLSHVSDAQRSYETALDLWRAVGDRRGQALALTGLGHLHVIVGENQQALDCYERAREPFERLSDRIGLARILNGIGTVHARSGDYETASGYFRQAIELFRSVKYRSGEATSLRVLGDQLYALGRRQEALQDYFAALEIFRAISNRRIEAHVLKSIGDLNVELGYADKALAYYRESRSLDHTVGDPRAEVYALDAIGALLYRRGKWNEGRNTLLEAFRLSEQSRTRYGESQVLYDLAKTEAALGNLELALSRIRASLELVEALRTDVASLDLRASYVASVRDRHALEIGFLTRLDQRHPYRHYDALAFEASERARARSFLDGLAQARSQIREGAPPALLEREGIIHRSLNATAQRLMEVPNDAGHAREIAALTHDLDDQTESYKDIEARIRAESPRYASLTQPEPLTLARVQQLLGDQQTVLVQYFLAKDQSYAWAVTQDGLAEYVLPARAEIERLARSYREALTGANAPPQTSGPAAVGRDRAVGGLVTKKGSPREQIGEAEQLSKILLGPVSRYLSHARVLVVADGILQAIPFGALPDPRSVGPNKAAVPLLVEHEVVNLPSMSTLALLRGEWNQDRRWAKAAMVFADPVYGPGDSRIAAATKSPPSAVRPGGPSGAEPANLLARAFRGTAVGQGVAAIPRLIETEREARGIAALAAPADVALGFDASRAAAMSAKLSDYRIVHFAVHGIVDNTHPELSGIVLSLFDRQGQSQDGVLRLHDIYNLKIPADLVVLSACDTGLGKDIVGEGLIGLVRGFMYAGTRRVVASLWEVDDEATSELMTRFYRGMFERRLSPPAALRAAQLDLLKNTKWKAPFYWAAFVLQGDWN